VWGSSALALATLINTAPDERWLASAILAPDRPDLLIGRSAFTGINAARPGQQLVIDGEAPRSWPVWKPPLADQSLADGASMLRAALSRAVSTRIDIADSWSADCSGGLDSTSLALLAAEQVPLGNEVWAVTVHPAGGAAGGDLDYARAATKGRRGLEHVLCPLTADHLPYSRMEDLMPATDEPAPTTVAIARAVAEFDLLREIGATDCHLTGDGGDTLLGGNPGDLTDLAHHRRWGPLLRHTVGWARLHHNGVGPLLADVVRIRQGPVTTSMPIWSTEHARGLVTDVAAANHQIWDRTLLAMRVVGRTARADLQVAEHNGLRVHNPFTDPQVIATALRTPSWVRATPYRYKYLLATAMADLLPPRVAGRGTKGDFTADHYLGLRANLPVLRELADGRLAELGLVQPARLCRVLDQAAAGLPISFSSFEPVIAAEVWLRSVHRAPSMPTWHPAGTGAGSISQ
jgi:asparagine synthase (glutamine-hydrolysing)